MGKIAFVSSDDRTFVPARQAAEADPVLHRALDEQPGDEIPVEMFVHHAGDTDRAELVEWRFPPEAHIPPHAHDTDEIMVVVDGSIVFGKQSYGVGSSIFVPRMTLYSFQTGPDGLTFLLYRPTRSASGVIYKADFLEMRR